MSKRIFDMNPASPDDAYFLRCRSIGFDMGEKPLEAKTPLSTIVYPFDIAGLAQRYVEAKRQVRLCEEELKRRGIDPERL